MAHDDDALHTRDKSLMQGMLNRDELPHIRTMAAKLSKDLLDAANGLLKLFYVRGDKNRLIIR